MWYENESISFLIELGKRQIALVHTDMMNYIKLLKIPFVEYTKRAVVEVLPLKNPVLSWK